MKIAILTSGILPIPAVLGGAVENLVDMYLDYNNCHHLHDITVYSIWQYDAVQHPANNSCANRYVFIKNNSLKAKLWKAVSRLFRCKKFYHDSIDYYLNEAVRQIKKDHYDLIVVENRPGYALTLSRHCTIPCVLHLHNDFIYSGAKQAEEITKAFRYIICVSDFITDRVRAVCSDPKKCKTVHNAIDVKAFQSAKPIDRQLLGLADDDFVLVFNGRLIEEKGILQLIQAMHRLQQIPRIKLVIIGANTYGEKQGDTSFTRQLRQEAASLKDKIVFTGFISYTDIPSYLKAADLAVLPSMWEEPFGLTIVEALAAGLPLISTYSGGIPEICKNVAVLVGRKSIVSNLVTAILDLYEHPEKRKAMAQASLEQSKLFDKDIYAKNFFAALQSLSSCL